MLTLENISELVGKNRVATSARVSEFPIGGRKFNFNSSPAIMGRGGIYPPTRGIEKACVYRLIPRSCAEKILAAQRRGNH